MTCNNNTNLDHFEIALRSDRKFPHPRTSHPNEILRYFVFHAHNVDECVDLPVPLLFLLVHHILRLYVQRMVLFE